MITQNEEKETQEPQVQTTGQSEAQTAQTQSANLVDKATEAALRLERANAQQLELIQRQEALYAKQQLGGQSEAAIQAPIVKPKSDVEFSKTATAEELFKPVDETQ